ncbi:hypothetical protein BC834DRAFT_1044681 [Gloeopeniophorella convolvens]|nr:hypothetical protein BC834DRAFT_1044681 [Gloeopeniophorella convolvens]
MSISPYEAAKVERDLNLNYLFNIVPLVVLYYDYALTFAREVELFWPHRARLNGISIVFFLNRYVSIVGHIPIAVSTVTQNAAEVCERIHKYNEYFEVILQLLVAALCAMRVYALYNKNRYILLGFGVIMCTTLIVGCTAIATEAGDAVTRVSYTSIRGCNSNLALSDEGGQFLAIAWSGVLVFDIIIFGLTLYKAFKVGYNVPLIRVLVRDGSLYFFVLFFVNLANILTLLLAPTLLKDSATAFTNVFSTTLVSRLMLNLRSDSASLMRSRDRRGQTADVPVTTTMLELGMLAHPTTILEREDGEEFEIQQPSGRVRGIPLLAPHFPPPLEMAYTDATSFTASLLSTNTTSSNFGTDKLTKPEKDFTTALSNLAEMHGSDYTPPAHGHSSKRTKKSTKKDGN